MNATARCVGTPNGWGGNYLWPPPPDQLIRQPCGWTGYDLAVTPARLDSLHEEAVASTGTCPHCGGQVELHPSGSGS